MQNPQDVQLAAEALRSLLPDEFKHLQRPLWGVVLGTGLAMGLSLRDSAAIPFSRLPGFPLPGVESHAGRFISGYCGDSPVIVQEGRIHLYEGRTPAEICMGVRIMGLLGCRTLIITNAAGALNPLFDPGSLMCICDMINHTGVSPLTGPSLWGERFPDMSRPFSPILIRHALKQAQGITLEKGVYIGVHGPEMETPAETRMYRQWGADAVGMSTVLEVIAARQMGIDCLGISCLTNLNLPDCMKPAPIEEVIQRARQTAPALSRLIRSIISTPFAEIEDD